MRKFVMLIAALGLVAAACGGDDASSCEGIADEAMDVVQDLINEFDSMTLDEMMSMEEEPPAFAEMENKMDSLQEQADSLGCTDDEMQQLFMDKADDLTADGEFGQMMLEGIRSEGLGN